MPLPVAAGLLPFVSSRWPPCEAPFAPPIRILTMIIVPIIGMVLGVGAITLACVFLLKHRESKTWARTVTFLGLAAAGMALWTLTLKK
jgi:hypothetical protein